MTLKMLGKRIVEVAYLEGDFVLSSGKRSNYYLDKYLFLGQPEILKAIATHIAQMIPDKVDRIAGPELGAVPLAAALSIQTGIPFVIVRKEAKGYGTSAQVEGGIKIGESLILIEDVATTGSQAIAAAEHLTRIGNKIVKIICVIDREEGAKQNAQEAGYTLESLFTKTGLGI